MNAIVKPEADTAVATIATGLGLLRQPFPENQISKLPKPTAKQTDLVKQDFKNGIRCPACGGWHHKDVVHLDYVGHAALTDRLLDCDPSWNWEPMAFSAEGTPLLDQHGGMWIRLTVCGVTRFGYGHADGKRGGDALKEVIGDALRNAAMRFGAALDLWHKGQLHAHDTDEAEVAETTPKKPALTEPEPRGPTIRDQRMADSMVSGIKQYGMTAVNNPKLQSDLVALRDRAAELAAMVDVEIEACKRNADADEIPY